MAVRDNPATQLYVVDMEGKALPRPLPNQPKGQSCLSVAWSLDGKHILVTTVRKLP